MGFTGRGIAMHGVAKIALFGPLLSQKRASSQHLYQQLTTALAPLIKRSVSERLHLLHL
jgi:hypothetical protein